MLRNDLEASAVRLRIGQQLLGTGFWAGPGLVVTCAHVVKDHQTVDVDARGEAHTGVVARCARADRVGDSLFPDFALIRVPTSHGMPVELDASCLPGDALHAWGFPGMASAGDSITGECEGFRNFGSLGTQRLIKLKNTQITPGFSGSPVLNLRTGLVCGMLKRTRDEASAAGGYAVRSTILLGDEEIAAAQRTLETPLRKELLEYLNRIIRQTGALPQYFPSHIQSFDNIRQRVRLIADRRRFHGFAASRSTRASSIPQDPYEPLHARPEDSPLDHTSVLELSIERWQIAQMGAVEWDRLRTDSRFRRLMILGDPGFGKTWLLRYEARRRALDCSAALSNELPDNLTIPVWMKLQDLAHHVSKTQALPQTLDLALESDGLSAEFRAYIAMQLPRGRVALLLDAWDEVAQERRALLRLQMEVWLRAYAGPVVLTSRPSAADGFRDVAVLELLAFERDEIVRYVAAWFPGKTSQRFLETLDAHRSINGLARIPLLLALLCRAFGEPGQALPVRRGRLCQLCLRGLLKQWKREDKAAEVDDLDVETSLAHLGRIALALYPASQFTITEVAAALNLPPADARMTIDALMRDGILMPTGSRDEDRLTFLHRTFHEYLAAWEWSRQPRNPALLDARSWDLTWSQVIVLLAGQLPDPNKMISQLLREDEDEKYRPRLALAIRCLQEQLDGDRSRVLVDRATAAAVGLWLAHSRADTADALLPLEGALEALPELDGHCQGQPLLAYALAANAADFLSLAAALGPEAATQEAIARVAALLQDPDVDLRRRAAEVVMSWGRRASVPGVVPSLIALSDSDNYTAQDAAVRALFSLGEKAATPEMLAHLTDSVPHSNFLLTWVSPDLMVAMGPKAATPEVLARLVTALGRPAADARSAAAGMLSALGEYAATPQVLRAILDLIAHDKREVGKDAVNTLVDLGPAAATSEVLAGLTQFLRRPGAPPAEAAIRALGGFGQYAATAPVIEALREMSSDPDPEIRCTAARAAGALGKEAANPVILKPLTLLLGGSDWMPCWSAAEALGRMGQPAATPAVLVRLLGLLKSGDWVLRWKAGTALRSLAGVSSIAEVLQDVTALIHHPEAQVRVAAAKIVGAAALDPVTPEAVACLLQLSHDGDPAVAAASLESLASLAEKIADPSQILDQVVELTRHESPLLRASAAEALGAFLAKEASPEALARLLDLLQDSDPAVSADASFALTRLQEKAATPASLSVLAQLVREPNLLVAGRAMEALWHLKDNAATREVVVSMLDMMRDEDPTATSRALYVLGRLGARAATPNVLDRLLALPHDRYIQKRVLEALEHLGEGAATPEVMTWLGAMMASSDLATRRAAAKTVRVLQQAAPNLRMPATRTPHGLHRRLSKALGSVLDRLRGAGFSLA